MAGRVSEQTPLAGNSLYGGACGLGLPIPFLPNYQEEEKEQKIVKLSSTSHFWLSLGEIFSQANQL